MIAKECLPCEEYSLNDLISIYNNTDNNKNILEKLYYKTWDYIETPKGKNHLKNWLWLIKSNQYEANVKRIFNYMSGNEWRQQYNSSYGDEIAENLLKQFTISLIGWFLHYKTKNNPSDFPYLYWQATPQDFRIMYLNLPDKSTHQVYKYVTIEYEE